MGASQSDCVLRERVDYGGMCCWARPPARDDEEQQELRASLERDRLLTMLEEKNPASRHKFERFYTAHELSEVDSFLQEFAVPRAGQPAKLSKAHTLVGMACGPWGISTERGVGNENAWDTMDATGYVVRGPGYTSDGKKEPSLSAIGELVVVDMFFSETDIPNVAACEAAKTVQRLRREGETRKLLLFNFRLVPLHVVVVWALPSVNGSNGTNGSKGPAQLLLDRFLGDMPNAERKTRLKGIPRIIQGPWAVRRVIGENSAAILGRNIPIDFYDGDNVLEVSFSISTSAAAQRVSRLLLRAARAIDLELALVIEGQTLEELPERILGGFRITYANLDTLRTVDPNEPARRPAFLATPELEGY